ncbi:transmembrane protein 33-like isoform X2 [Varroa jacobsoni]|uniref:Transmembrane protein 33 n=1 Tax=Varroa destructor TaxID=109461 RepID=A0A7M7KH38_VARDE|nr:transmembrane protein 33-like isoform X2 [Varroa destructor]XP_022697790.1 transmembrane protein 33-like isoform X2 [Varroa jacobsoni]
MADNSEGDTRPQDQPRQQTQPRGIKDIIVDLVEQKMELLLWLSRLACTMFTVSYLLGGLGGNPYSLYQKALICNGVTSALRLHQRAPTVRLNAEFLTTILVEDSCHYLIYSLIFLSCPPISMVLLPPMLFAVLHSTLFSLQLLERAGLQHSKVSECLRILLQSNRVFRLIAMTEIFLMPTVIIGLFCGRVSLMAPFMYYRFLKLRYASMRNPYNRNVFYELKLHANQLAALPNCPMIIQRGIYFIVRFIESRAG